MSLFSSSAELLCQWKVCSPSHITGNPVTPEEVVRADSLSGLLMELGRTKGNATGLRCTSWSLKMALCPRLLFCVSGKQINRASAKNININAEGNISISAVLSPSKAVGQVQGPKYTKQKAQKGNSKFIASYLKTHLV